jgi:hypothetical protein
MGLYKEGKMYGRDLFYGLIIHLHSYASFSRLGRYLPGRKRLAWPAGLWEALGWGYKRDLNPHLQRMAYYQ